MKLLTFELRRAIALHTSALYFFQLTTVLPLFAYFVSVIKLPADLASAEFSDPKLIGGMWGTMIAAQTLSKAKDTAVSDIWVILDKSPHTQVLQVFLAWLPLSLIQGFIFIVSLVVFEVGTLDYTVFLHFMIGFLVALPAGLCLSMITRVFPSISLFLGLVFIGGLFFARNKMILIDQMTSTDFLLVFSSYLSATGIIYWLLGSLVRNRL